MSKPRPTSAEPAFALVWAAAGLLEAPTIALMLGLPLPIPAPLGVAAHFAAAALVFFAAPKEKGWLKKSRHWGAPLGTIALLLPGIGWALAGWLLLGHGDAPYDKEAYRFDDESAEEVNPLAALGTAAAVERELADALDVIPAVDALLSRTPALKRGAIETLARIRTFEAIAWIFKARADDDPEVRFYATSALTRLKRDFETAIQAAEREAYKRPGEFPAQLALQRVRYEYAASGILDANARAGILEGCRAKLAPSAERRPEAARLLYLVERTLAPERALGLLDRLEAADPERVHRWTKERAELLFSLGRLKELRALMKLRAPHFEQEPIGVDGHDWRSVVLWWSER